MGSKLKLNGVILLCLLLQAFACACVLAAGGEQASSPGTPGQKQLKLLSVTLDSGVKVQDAADMPLNSEFILQFDKNVVNSVIWENNSKCFSITAADGEYVPVSVTKVDDTIDVSQRQKIFVKPVSFLNPGKVYCLRISPELKAKNGVAMGGEGVSVTFKTAGEAAAAPLQPGQEGVPPAVAPDVAGSKDNLQKEVADKTGQIASTNVKTDSERENIKRSFRSRFATVGLFLIGGWIAFEILNRRKNNRERR